MADDDTQSYLKAAVANLDTLATWPTLGDPALILAKAQTHATLAVAEELSKLNKNFAYLVQFFMRRGGK